MNGLASMMLTYFFNTTMLGKSIFFSLAASLAVVNAQAAITDHGNCISGPLKYSAKRVANIAGKESNPIDPEIPVATTDFLAEFVSVCFIADILNRGFRKTLLKGQMAGSQSQWPKTLLAVIILQPSCLLHDTFFTVNSLLG